jgi:hypothetical protein
MIDYRKTYSPIKIKTYSGDFCKIRVVEDFGGEQSCVRITKHILSKLKHNLPIIKTYKEYFLYEEIIILKHSTLFNIVNMVIQNLTQEEHNIINNDTI